jgi:hypothetical protein
MPNAKRTGTHKAAPAEYPEQLVSSSANPCYRALELLGCINSKSKSLAAFDGRASIWQVVDWRLGRRGMPPWAVETLRQKLEQAKQPFDIVGAALQPGRGPSWNKNATRGLGEWRARKNQKVD